MGASKHKHTVIEAQNVALGQAGCEYLTGTGSTANSGVYGAITIINDTGFTTLTPEDSSFIGDTGGAGDDVGETFPAGVTIFGRWTAINLSTGTGRVVCYRG